MHGSLFGIVKQHQSVIDSTTKKMLSKVVISVNNPEVETKNNKVKDRKEE